MMVEVVSHAITAGALLVLSFQLLTLVRNVQLGNVMIKSWETEINKKQKQYYQLLTFFVFFALFIGICAVNHVFSIMCTFFPTDQAVKSTQSVILVVGAVLSLITASVALMIFPMSSSSPPRYQITSEYLDHAKDYMLEIVDMVKESIMVISSDLKIVRKNEASKELFGAPSLVGKSILEFIHPDDVRNFELFAASALASYNAIPMTIEYRIKPEAHVHISRRRSRSPIQLSGRFHSRVYCDDPEASTSAGKALTTSSGHNNTIPSANPFAHTSSTASLVERQVAVSVSVPEFVWLESTMLKHAYVDKDDVIRSTIEMVSRNIDERKRKQQSQFDSIVKQTEEQSRINSAKLRYISCIAHDLKTPLQSFCYTLDLLLQTRLTSEQREFIQQANVAVDLMKLTISQTMDISKALTGAKLQPRRTSFNLSTVLKRVEILISGYGKQVPVIFMREPDIIDEIITDEEWLWQMLLNLLTNACKYTDKGSITAKVSPLDTQAAPPRYQNDSQRSMTINLSKLQLSPSAPLMLLFEVIDTGVGVKEADLLNMFESFNQVQDGQVSGTGLGLYGVRMRAEGLKGTCGARHNIESPTGTGTVMWFAIPYLPDRIRSNSDDLIVVAPSAGAGAGGGTPSNPSSAPPESSSFHSSSVFSKGANLPSPSEVARTALEILRARPVTAMVVEDTMTVRKLMERMLQQMGFATVMGYENGSKGLDAMMAGTVDIVFSDVQMPIMTGPEMVSRFREFEAGALASGARNKRQVVVAVTANGSEMRDNANKGFDEVYPKPLGRNDIYKIINRFL